MLEGQRENDPAEGNNVTANSRVVIIGAGVAGIRAAKDLPKRIRKPGWDIVLIDQNDYHQYLYRIHEVCNLEYDQKDITVPIARLIDGERVEFKKAVVTNVDTKRKVVVTETGEEPYDVLIVTLGSHPAYFNIPGIRENSLTLGSFVKDR
jgi:NADH dehydrogenase